MSFTNPSPTEHGLSVHTANLIKETRIQRTLEQLLPTPVRSLNEEEFRTGVAQAITLALKNIRYYILLLLIVLILVQSTRSSQSSAGGKRISVLLKKIKFGESHYKKLFEEAKNKLEKMVDIILASLMKQF